MKTEEAINKARQVIRRQHKALSTEDTYIFWLRRYMVALRGMPEGLSSERKLERFLTDLARYRDVSASTQNQAFNSILFFYRDVLGQTIGKVNALRAKRPVQRRSNRRLEFQLCAWFDNGCSFVLSLRPAV